MAACLRHLLHLFVRLRFSPVIIPIAMAKNKVVRGVK